MILLDSFSVWMLNEKKKHFVLEHWIFTTNIVTAWDEDVYGTLQEQDIRFEPDTWLGDEISAFLDGVCRDSFRELCKQNVPVYQSAGLDPWDWSYTTYVRPSPTLEHLRTLTCWNCPHALSCPSTWDAYNTNGDCLELK
jgi:hypothetical protein